MKTMIIVIYFNLRMLWTLLMKKTIFTKKQGNLLIGLFFIILNLPNMKLKKLKNFKNELMKRNINYLHSK